MYVYISEQSHSQLAYMCAKLCHMCCAQLRSRVSSQNGNKVCLKITSVDEPSVSTVTRRYNLILSLSRY